VVVELIGDSKKAHDEELQDLGSSTNDWLIKSRRMRWAGHVAYMGERRGGCRVLVGKPEGKRPIGRASIDDRPTVKCILENRIEGHGLNQPGSG
jgi:hypothetical protein